MERKFVVFDIDGTLYNSHLGVEFLKEMSDLDAIRGVTREEFAKQYQEWQQSEDRTAYYYQWFNKYYDFNLKGVPRKTFEKAAHKIAAHAFPHFYPEIMQELAKRKEEGRFVILISKSPEQAVAEIAHLLEADDHWGSAFNFDDEGNYVNQYEYEKDATDKATIIKGLLEAHHLTLEDSFAYGDSVGDISMLHLVEHPVAVNPEPGLLSEAKANDWAILRTSYVK